MKKRIFCFTYRSSFLLCLLHNSLTQNSLVSHCRKRNCLLLGQILVSLYWTQICLTQWYQNLAYSLSLASHLLPGQKDNYFKMLKCMKFAPLSSLGAVISNQPFGFFFWSIFNCLVGKAKLLLQSLIFLSSAVTWISPFFQSSPSAAYRPSTARSFQQSPRCQVRSNHSAFAACSILLLFRAFKGRTPSQCAQHLRRAPRSWRRCRSSCCCPRTAEELGLAGRSCLALI